MIPDAVVDALPIGGALIGALAGLPAGPFGAAGFGAGGAALGETLQQLIQDGAIDPVDVAKAAAFGAIPGPAGKVAGPAARATGRLAKEFAPDAAGAFLGSTAGQMFGPLGGFTGAVAGRRVAADLAKRSGTARQRVAKAVVGRPKGSAPRQSTEAPEIGSNAERAAGLRRELLGM
jgi:hypothetical protein